MDNQLFRWLQRLPYRALFCCGLCAGFLPASLQAQFNGGSGDGFVNGTTVQLTLDGLPNGVIALYGGGAGDGFDRTTGQLTLAGANLAVLYGGGRGDGFDVKVQSLTLSGQELAALFRGGSGDGFDDEQLNVTLSGQSLAALFGGGSGNGFDDGQINVTLDGQALAALFGGGSGDGFDAATDNFTLSGAMLSALYGGGGGDGFDTRRVGLTLSGASLARLYGGGTGDGFDVTLFAGSIPLPLTLLSFEAFPGEDFVLLKWQTEDELDTDFFTIERTRNGIAFADVGDVLASGFSEPGEVLHYELNDERPLEGNSFYRLKTTDFDGAVSLSHLIEVEFNQEADWSFQLFPNPSTGRHFNVRTEGLAAEAEVTIQVMDNTGRQLFTERFRNGRAAARIELAARLTAGSYLIRVGNAEAGFRAKILIVGGAGIR
ncbi:T9SS type A sorting domain-containing protein [Neolewinella antarctica]|uniref:Secretion system C-terminal sorting domain-containing protein n=1 Tax=Neolewinella antarctica TaxID=442734 RepID=A0ABX0X9R5_9BACT|nr:T9SS type A sorting domain-containing protein [Neolewinella antarctica]NJC26005.1 hypothetical protein [Neolewinella antarctica]